MIHDDRMHSFFLAETLKHAGGHFTAAGTSRRALHGGHFTAAGTSPRVEGHLEGAPRTSGGICTRGGAPRRAAGALLGRYLYLLFGEASDERSTVPLHSYVFNTEAHPLELHPDYEYGRRYGGRCEAWSWPAWTWLEFWSADGLVGLLNRVFRSQLWNVLAWLVLACVGRRCYPIWIQAMRD